MNIWLYGLKGVRVAIALVDGRALPWGSATARGSAWRTGRPGKRPPKPKTRYITPIRLWSSVKSQLCNAVAVRQIVVGGGRVKLFSRVLVIIFLPLSSGPRWGRGLVDWPIGWPVGKAIRLAARFAGFFHRRDSPLAVSRRPPRMDFASTAAANSLGVGCRCRHRLVIRWISHALDVFDDRLQFFLFVRRAAEAGRLRKAFRFPNGLPFALIP